MVTSALPASEVIRRLGDLIGPHRPYAGDVGAGRFTARRRRTLARFGLPVARGSVRSEGGRTVIDVELRLDPVFVALYAGWAVIMLAASAALVRASVEAGALDAGSLGPAALVAFVHVMMLASFAGETALLRRWLESVARGRAAA